MAKAGGRHSGSCVHGGERRRARDGRRARPDDAGGSVAVLHRDAVMRARWGIDHDDVGPSLVVALASIAGGLMWVGLLTALSPPAFYCSLGACSTGVMLVSIFVAPSLITVVFGHLFGWANRLIPIASSLSTPAMVTPIFMTSSPNDEFLSEPWNVAFFSVFFLLVAIILAIMVGAALRSWPSDISRWALPGTALLLIAAGSVLTWIISAGDPSNGDLTMVTGMEGRRLGLVVFALAFIAIVARAFERPGGRATLVRLVAASPICVVAAVAIQPRLQLPIRAEVFWRGDGLLVSGLGAVLVLVWTFSSATNGVRP